MDTIVEYQRLRPEAMTRRRNTMPVAYMGLGILEWHGLHNPLGLDGIKANGIACCLADRLGGVVMPAQFWGDYRQSIADLEFTESFEADFSQPENRFDHTARISELYGIEKGALEKDAARSREYGEWELWEKMMVRSLSQIEALGFKAIVLLPGHFHLIAASERAIKRYLDEGGICETMSLSEFSFPADRIPADHAAAFETSLMLALCPELVDIDELDKDLQKPNIGVIGFDPRVYASAEYGWEIVEKFVEAAKGFISSVIERA